MATAAMSHAVHLSMSKVAAGGKRHRESISYTNQEVERILMELRYERHILQETCRKPSCLIALRRAVAGMSHTGIDAACGASSKAGIVC